ncbi:MAG: hypothetical protein AAB483_03180 [Patescibacteria group bacterium]
MDWAHFFHIYQPADQKPDILEAVVATSYRPLLEGFLRFKNIRATLNITGSLLELFDKHDYTDLIDLLRELGREGRIEFTGSAKYHSFLPLLPEQEITRQIAINSESNKFFLGDAFHPRGFFPPEMAYDPKLVPIVEGLGFQWIILDEIALSGAGEPLDFTKRYCIKGSKLQAVFRERRLSNLIVGSIARTPATLLAATQEDREVERYAVTAMDGEVFGHHQPGLEKVLFEMFAMPEFRWRTISDLEQLYPEVREIHPVTSTWASSQLDIDRGVQFLSWQDPDNEIHALQWEFLHSVLKALHAVPESDSHFKDLRVQMDQALASDQFWWASAKPWWSVEMIEQGAHRLLEIAKAIPTASPTSIAFAEHCYQQIVARAFDWQRTRRVEGTISEHRKIQQIPFQDRTLGKGGAEEGVYHAFVAMMKDLEQKAAGAGEYEHAILWRDAIHKLEQKHDIYDAVSAVDLLRTKLPHELVEKTIEEYKKKYLHIRGGQPEKRGE